RSSRALLASRVLRRGRSLPRRCTSSPRLAGKTELRSYLLDRNSSSRLQTATRRLHPSDKPWIVFELVIKPIVLVFETDQHCSRPAVACDDDLLVCRKLNIPGQI